MKQDTVALGLAAATSRPSRRSREDLQLRAAARVAHWSEVAYTRLSGSTTEAERDLAVQHFEQFVNAIPSGVVIASADTQHRSPGLIVRVVNPAIVDLVDLDHREVIGSALETFLGNFTGNMNVASELRTLVTHAERTGQASSFQCLARAGDKPRARCFDIKIVPIGAASVALIFEDVSERTNSAEPVLRQRASTDDLTRLANRSVLLQRLDEHQRANDGSALTLLLVDLDGFKEVNETFGYECGDLILQQVAARFLAEVPSDALVARLGGDEFGVLLAGNNATDEGIKVALQLADCLRRPIELAPHLELKVGASVGIASVPEHAEQATMLLARADMAMYSAKRKGGGFAVFESEQGQASERKMVLLGDLHRAIGSGELTLHYQPVVDIHGSIVGGEGLIRWNHPDLGLIYPSEFIDLIEIGNLSNALALTVVRQAVQQAQVAHTCGYPIGLSVNLSPRDLHDTHLVQTISRLIEDSLLPRWTITVEITERQLFAEAHEVSSAIADLRAAGARVSIDDFGTGNTSMYLLRRIDVDELKIDEVFIQDLHLGREHIVKAIIEMAHELGLSVVAEGVEERDTIGVLRNLGCDRMQGYALSHPLRADAFTELLRSWQHTMV